MKKMIALGAMMLACLVDAPAPARAQVQAGLALGNSVAGFRLAIGQYFHIPPEQVTACVQQRLPEEEMPVVFFIAAQAHVAPGVVLRLRAGGMPWSQVTAHFRVSPRAFYVPFQGPVAGTPYERYYSYYRGGKVQLTDADFVNMANLRFTCDYDHRKPGEVLRLRAEGRSFPQIHDQCSSRPGDRRPVDSPCSGTVSGNVVVDCGDPLPCVFSGNLEITCPHYTDLSAIQTASGNITTCTAPSRMPATFSGRLFIDPSLAR